MVAWGDALLAPLSRQIGSRLRARRTHLGLSINNVARELGIGANQYRAYESGAKLTPELLLTRIAEYFGVPALWLSPNLVHKTADAQKAVLRDRYRVATVEDRVNDLITVFCKLDLERQQELSRRCRRACAPGVVEAMRKLNALTGGNTRP